MCTESDWKATNADRRSLSFPPSNGNSEEKCPTPWFHWRQQEEEEPGSILVDLLKFWHWVFTLEVLSDHVTAAYAANQAYA